MSSFYTQGRKILYPEPGCKTFLPGGAAVRVSSQLTAAQGARKNLTTSAHPLDPGPSNPGEIVNRTSPVVLDVRGGT